MLSIPVSLFLSKDSGDKGTLIRVLQYTRGIYEEQKRNEGGGLLSNMPQLAEITGKPLREAWEKDQYVNIRCPGLTQLIVPIQGPPKPELFIFK